MHFISAVSHHLRSELFFGCSPFFLLHIESMSHIRLIHVPGFLRGAADELPYSPDISFVSIFCCPAVTSNWAQFNCLQGCIGKQCPCTTSSIIHDLGRGKWLGWFLLFLLIWLSFCTQKGKLGLWFIYTIFLRMKTKLYMLSIFLPLLCVFNNW